MPFAVVETVNARGHKELSVVPDKWLQSSKNGSVVLWPNVKNVTEQEKLLRDEYSSPNKSWLIYKCSVKRNPISSLPEAKRMMEDLSGESSSDVAQLIRRKRKLVNPNTGNFQKMLILDSAPFTTPVEKTTHSPETIVVEVPGTVQHEMLHQTPATPILPASSRTVVTKPKHTTPVATEKNKETDIHTPQAAPKTIFNATAASTEKNSQTVHYETIPPGVSPSAVVTAISADNSSTVQYVAYETVHESNLPKNSGNATTDMQFVINTTSAIFDQQHQTNTRLDRLEKRVADIVIQNEFIVDAIRKLSSQKTLNEEAPSIWFDPIQNAEQLADLDLKLANNDFKSNMVKWLRTNATGDCADNRMLAVLDVLLSKEFQTKCSWTGVGRKGPKIAIMPNRNILQLFQFIGTDDTEIVTQQKLASFFMKKLKNSLKRMMVHGRRRGTRHVRKHRKPEEERTGDEADPNPIDSSNAPNGQDDEDDNGHIEPGVNETVESCVDSSDAQEYANFLSESSGADDSSD